MEVDQAGAQVVVVDPVGHGAVVVVRDQDRQGEAVEQSFGGAFPFGGVGADLDQFAGEGQFGRGQVQLRTHLLTQLQARVRNVARLAAQAAQLCVERLGDVGESVDFGLRFGEFSAKLPTCCLAASRLFGDLRAPGLELRDVVDRRQTGLGEQASELVGASAPLLLLFFRASEFGLDLGYAVPSVAGSLDLQRGLAVAQLRQLFACQSECLVDIVTMGASGD